MTSAENGSCVGRKKRAADHLQATSSALDSRFGLSERMNSISNPSNTVAWLVLADGAPHLTETTALFHAWRDGDRGAFDRLFRQFEPELARVALGMLRQERHVSLAAADLVQETVLRMIQLRRIDYQDRAHFLALASRFMRRVLIDHMRAKRSDRRDHVAVTLVTGRHGAGPADLMALNESLIRLAQIDPQRAEIVEMRYFGGMSLADIGAVLSLSEATVKRRWVTARGWLVESLNDPFRHAQFDA